MLPAMSFHCIPAKKYMLKQCPKYRSEKGLPDPYLSSWNWLTFSKNKNWIYGVNTWFLPTLGVRQFQLLTCVQIMLTCAQIIPTLQDTHLTTQAVSQMQGLMPSVQSNPPTQTTISSSNAGRVPNAGPDAVRPIKISHANHHLRQPNHHLLQPRRP